MAENFEAIVIGSGPGGTSCATLLQKHGVNTVLIEKNNLLGGKMMSVDKDGYAYDLFPHGQVPMRGNAFEQLFAELGVSEDYQPALEPDDQREMITLCYRRGDWSDYRRIRQGQAMADASPFFKLWDLSEEEQQQTIDLMAEIAVMQDQEIGEFDDITMDEWLSRRTVPSPLYNYFGFHANASLAEPLDLVAASEQLLIMKQLMLNGGGGQYKGGFAMLTNVMIREFEKNGGTVIRNNRVDKIIIEDGRVAGVAAHKGVLRAPVVVSSAGIQPTVLKLVGAEYFDNAYVDYVNNLVPGLGFTSIRYFLDKPAMNTAIYVAWSDDSWWNLERIERINNGEMPEEVILFMCNHSFYDPGAAPPGKQMLVSGTICSPDPEAPEIEFLWKKMDEQMQKFFPEIWQAIEREEYNGPREIRDLTRDSVVAGQGGECVGLGQIAGQCGALKPKSETSIPGLYIAGADAGSKGMGTHQSALSGMAVAAMVEAYLQPRAGAHGAHA